MFGYVEEVYEIEGCPGFTVRREIFLQLIHDGVKVCGADFEICGADDGGTYCVDIVDDLPANTEFQCGCWLSKLVLCVSTACRGVLEDVAHDCV